jgi:hypothetical protein
VVGDQVPAADEDIVSTAPLHILVTDGVRTGAGGTGFTETVVVAVVVQVPLVAEKVYIPPVVTPVSTLLREVEV